MELGQNMLEDRISSLCYAGLSVGGDGLCCIFRIAYPERHKAHFYALVDEIQGRTPLIVDESGSDVVRLRVASYDPQPYFNPDAPPYLYYKPNKYSAPRRVKKARKAVMDVATKQRTYSLIIIIQKNRLISLLDVQSGNPSDKLSPVNLGPKKDYDFSTW